VILLCGIPSEDPVALVHAALERRGAEVVLFNQRRFDGVRLHFDVTGSAVRGRLDMDGSAYRLEDIAGVYLRAMDDRLLPELAGEQPDSTRRTRCRALHETLVRWCDVSPSRVVNRASAQSSNSSKPYQAQLIVAHGFDVPETLITNEPDAVHEFRRRCGRIVYKSISGVRSVVRLLDDDDLPRLHHIRWCPVQFQEFVEGDNVRVHVVGEQLFATRIVSDATDYRYAADQVGRAAELRPHELDDDVAERCIALARGLGLPFAGIDLKITPEGRTVCFEVNPSPGFSYYEANTGQPIAAAVADYLMDGERCRACE
jgi:hypothetical protein